MIRKSKKQVNPLNAYPDLLRRQKEELAKAGNCGACGRKRILNKYKSLAELRAKNKK